ncbi:YciI family protein [Hyphomonas sp. WL0036]|uniref:YciI family protein n=1 Tax=Hyphomonas sediminis TaxID=2866160 RepID=UPI001C7F9A46|nr:YciI family protein [Hyphomonas sediminis]MBY9066953.1 YciI family protein [Hyphomonas sediminis]
MSTPAAPAPPPHVPKMGQPCYLVTCVDGPGAAELRILHMATHFAHIERHWQRFITAGPVRAPGGGPITGSAFLVLGDTLEEVQALLAHDPYISCGMYASVEYRELTNAAGLFIGGKIWDDTEDFVRRIAGATG